jgi:hypothetical protein
LEKNLALFTPDAANLFKICRSQHCLLRKTPIFMPKIFANFYAENFCQFFMPKIGKNHREE